MMGADTIAAVATAPGRAGLAVVRVSGPGAGGLASSLGFADLEPRRATYGRLVHPEDGRTVDQVVLTLFPGPESYTGEDVVEIGCHGGPLAPGLVLDAALAAGAREARAGEFTRRAFLNGKMDLLQVEATEDLVEARSEAAHRSAVHQLEGGLSRRIEDLRQRLVDLQSLLAYDIDFPEEDEGPVPPERIREGTDVLLDRLDRLLAHTPEAEMVREGALTVIAGRPNAGKSSLFNALLGRERAIVTDVPGTTRDAVEAVVSLDGYPFRLVDTAGIRESSDRMESLGIEVARGYLEQADLVLFCVEAGRSLTAREREFLAGREGDGPEVIRVRTKADLVEAGLDGPSPDGGGGGGLAVAAPVGRGLAVLRERLLEAAYSGVRRRREEAAPLVTRKRQIRALEGAREEVQAFREARTRGLPAEVAVTHLQEATRRLETLVGAVGTEDLLDAVFSGFCVGK